MMTYETPVGKASNIWLAMDFSLVGISLLAVILLDFLVIRRIPVLQRAFA